MYLMVVGLFMLGSGFSVLVLGYVGYFLFVVGFGGLVIIVVFFWCLLL